MVEENEVIALILSLSVMFFFLSNRVRIKGLPEQSLLLGGFYSFLAAGVLTVLEGIFWGNVLNVIEHICYTAGSVFLAVWLRQVLRKGDSRL